MFETYLVVANALGLLATDTKREYLDDIVKKMSKLHEVYVASKSDLYSQKEIEELGDSLQSVTYKFALSAMALEQLWALSHNTRFSVWSAIENSLSSLDISDNDLLLCSFGLETFLLQSNAFIRFYMLYLCLLLKTGVEGHITKDKFEKQLANVVEPRFRTKSDQILKYFSTNVFGEYKPDAAFRQDWGSLIKSLRDKISHRDRIRASFHSEEFLLDEIRFNWPTLQDATYDRFCQEMQNCMFAMIEDLTPVVYERDWMPGQYNEQLWNDG